MEPFGAINEELKFVDEPLKQFNEYEEHLINTLRGYQQISTDTRRQTTL